ncbi:MAG TPA: PAS domain S-box protein [Bryobacteraceae bacterium]|nr:PAS domain S-box protein [Bryobacteraceae bacterium]
MPPAVSAWMWRRVQKTGWRVLRSLTSVALIAGILASCLSLPNIDHATVALLLVAATGGLAMLWGWVEALAGAVAGAVGLAYYFLPPAGFSIASPEHVVALTAFLLIAIAIGQLADRSKRLLAQRGKLLNLSPDPLCIRGLNGDFRSANEAIVKILGWSESELCSRPFLEFVHPDDRAQTKAAWDEIARGRSATNVENRYLTKDGRWRWLSWTLAAPALGESQMSSAARDVTEEKLAREKLRDLAAQLMTAQEEERRRIARELHDDVTQRLSAVGIELGLLKRSGDQHEVVEGLQAQIFELSDDLRSLSHSLHPSILEYADLPATLEMYCRKFTEQHAIAAAFTAREVPPEIPRAAAVALFRIAQESLRNVALHSGATAASVILAGEDGGSLSLFIIDNGKGFDAGKIKAGSGLGLLSIEERARNMGASVSIDSTPEAGTRLTVKVPLGETERNT